MHVEVLELRGHLAGVDPRATTFMIVSMVVTLAPSFCGRKPIGRDLDVLRGRTCN
jgi:hypothetical protein